MSKQLYEEALADIKQLKQIAEDNAKREIIEAVTPKIRELIENQLLNEDHHDHHDHDMLLIDDNEKPEVAAMPSSVDAFELPDEEDVDGMDDELELSADASSLEDVAELSALKAESVELQIHRVYDEIAKKIKTDSLKTSNLSDLKLKVESLYNTLHDIGTDASKVETLGEKLEECFSVLEFANGAMENNMRRKLNEGDVTLVLHNMPDDLSLDDVTVDLVAKEGGGEEAEGGEEAAPEGEEAPEGGEEAAPEGEEAEGGEEAAPEGEEEAEGGEEKKTAAEGRYMEFDPIVEIDEKELREAIKSMRALTESADDSLDEYALGEDDDLSEEEEVADKKEPSAEEDSDDLFEDDMNEKTCEVHEVAGCTECMSEDELLEYGTNEESTDEGLFEDGVEESGTPNSLGGGRRRADAIGSARAEGHYSMAEAKAAGPKPKHNAMGAAKLKKPLGADGKEMKDKDWVMSKGKKVPVGKTVEKMKDKGGKTPTVPASVSMKPVKESSGATEIDSLRAQLAEVNLFNAKLLYTNKLLQNEALTARQKAQIIEQLDEAASLREVKLVYESLQKTLATKAPIRESADRVVGTSSRPTSSGGTSSVLSESIEASRWARLAGIK